MEEKLFEKELSLFESGKSIRNFTENVLGALPAYFTQTEKENTESIPVNTAKRDFSMAEQILSLMEYQRRFPKKDRDLIRAALLLKDGFLYGDGEVMTEKPYHAVNMAEYIKHPFWERYLPVSDRYCIADMILFHEGINRTTGPGPLTDTELFVLTVCRASAYARTPEWKDEFAEPAESPEDFAKKMEMAKEIIGERHWDGATYSDLSGCHIILDGVECNIPRELRIAFQTLGQMLPCRDSPYLNSDTELFSPENFKRVHPSWDGEVSGEEGNYHVKVSEDEGVESLPVSDVQAYFLGADPPNGAFRPQFYMDDEREY